MSECIQNSPGQEEACYAKVFYNDCKPRTSRLAIFFGGGDAECPTVTASKEIVKKYTETEDFIFVCVGLQETNDGMSKLPFNQEAARVDSSLRLVTQAARNNFNWDGSELLITGVSHGATSPMTAMARTALDNNPWWYGSAKSGVCLYDGVYDIPAQFDMYREDPTYLDLANWLNNQTSCAYMFARHCQRYTGRTVCDIGQDYLTSSSLTAEQKNQIALDSISRSPATGYAHTKFKLIECGSALAGLTPPVPLCDLINGDMVPKEPIETLCDNLNAQPGHSCTFGAMPYTSHTLCSFLPAGVDQCIDWFRSL